MIKCMNSIQNINFYAGKGLKKQNDVTDPVSQDSQIGVSFKGAEALAAYNSNLVNKNELSDIPILKPLNIPLEIDKVNGEKIYDSDGKLAGIGANYDDKKVMYYIDNDKISYITADEKDNNARWMINLYDNKLWSVQKFMRDGVKYETVYLDNGTVGIASKELKTKSGELIYNYYPDWQEYHVENIYYHNGVRCTSSARFDKNKVCQSFDSKEESHGTRTDFYKGKPYRTETYETTYYNNVEKDDINLSNLKPHPEYDFDINNAKSLKGQKTYYSNGKLNKILAEDGKIYKFDVDEKLDSIYDGTKVIKYGYKDGTDSLNWYEINETMSDGGEKSTMYHLSEEDGCSVRYSKNDIGQVVEYYKNGNIASYRKFAEGEPVIIRDYDKSGNTVWYND